MFKLSQTQEDGSGGPLIRSTAISLFLLRGLIIVVIFLFARCVNIYNYTPIRQNGSLTTVMEHIISNKH
jgi:hypothetical protein